MDTAIPLTSIAVILGAPYISQKGLMSFAPLESIVLRVGLVAAVLYALQTGAMNACLAFLAVATLLIERNHEVLTQLPNQMPHWPDNRQGVPLAIGERVFPHRYAMGVPVKGAPRGSVEQSMPYEATEEGGLAVVESHGESTTTSEFEEAKDLQDSIPRLREAPDVDEAPSFYASRSLSVQPNQTNRA